MTQSIDKPLKSTLHVPPPSSAPKRLGWMFGLTLSVTILILGGAIAAGIGIVVAINNPQDSAKKPWVVQWLDSLQSPTTSEEAVPIPSPTTPTAPTPQDLQNEIVGLQTQLESVNQQLKNIGDRTATLEQELDVQVASQDLSKRLQALQQRAESLPKPTPQITPLPPSEASVLPGDFKLTFSNELIFNEQGELSNEGKSLLENIVKNLSQYEGSSIRIAGYTDVGNTPGENREISYDRARTVERYLAGSLQGNYRWVSIGYGQTRPIATVENSNNPGNRRLEIAVEQ